MSVERARVCAERVTTRHGRRPDGGDVERHARRRREHTRRGTATVDHGARVDAPTRIDARAREKTGRNDGLTNPSS